MTAVMMRLVGREVDRGGTLTSSRFWRRAIVLLAANVEGSRGEDGREEGEAGGGATQGVRGSEKEVEVLALVLRAGEKP